MCYNQAMKDDIIQLMNQWAPIESAEPWDAVGLQIDTTATIEHVAIALEVNVATWPQLLMAKPDLIVSHHPLLFKPLHQLNFDRWTDDVIRDMIKNDMGLFVAHTNLDKANQGVSHALLDCFELNDSFETQWPFFNNYGIRVNFNAPVFFDDFDGKLEPKIKVPPQRQLIQSAVFMGGSGKSLVPAIIQQPVDVFVTGELGYHDIETLKQYGVGVILLGHYESELPVLQKIADRLQPAGVHCNIYT